MRLVNIGVAGISVKVGDFEGNLNRLYAVMDAARAQNVHLLVTPELCISGYSLEDRVYWADLIDESWRQLERLTVHTKGFGVWVGLPVRIASMLYNASAFVYDGQVQGLVLKRHLPTYSIFYEGRNWTAWAGGVTQVNGVPAGDLVFQMPYGGVSAEICEDMWSATSPALARVLAGAEIICNPSASPFTPLKNEERKRLVLGAASSLKSVYAYANLLGCDNSRLVFDGGGIIAAPDGLVAEGALLSRQPWTLTTGVVDLDDVARGRGENTTWRKDASRRAPEETVSVVDCTGGAWKPAPVAQYIAQWPRTFFSTEPHPAATRNRWLDELFDALVLGLRDYFEKVGVFQKYLVALSGGRDSALCLLLAVEAAKSLKAESAPEDFAKHVDTVYLPTKHSTAETQEAARALAEALGVSFRVLPIQDESDLALEKAAFLSDGVEHVAPLARQNLQARVRGAILLNWANSVGGLVLVTSNLSEMAVGYSTTGGDNQGGFSPIANVPKTLVSELLAYIAQREGITPLQSVLAIPPSAELAPGQTDESDLMPYVVLDDLLHLYARKRLGLADCWRALCVRHAGHTPEQLRTWTADFARRFVANQWKRDQHPVSLKVMDLDLDPKTGFRFPVTQSIAHELEALANATH